jgi:quercetin dioxygenase-like cupin family protein
MLEFKYIKNKTMAEIINFNELIAYASGSVVSKQIIKKDTGNVTLFAFDKGEGLSEHTAPFDAMVQVLEGQVEILIGGKPFLLGAGETIIMPAHVSHALKALEKFKMLLTMIKE